MDPRANDKIKKILILSPIESRPCLCVGSTYIMCLRLATLVEGLFYTDSLSHRLHFSAQNNGANAHAGYTGTK